MITLDEAIRHYEENAEYGEEYRQLAEWLKELKWRQVKMDNFADGDVEEPDTITIRISVNITGEELRKVCYAIVDLLNDRFSNLEILNVRYN